MAEDHVKGKNIAKDEGEDVEGHANLGANVGSNVGSNVGQNIGHDDEDDVEGHVNLNRANLGQQKA